MSNRPRWSQIPAARSSANVLAIRLRLVLAALIGSAALGAVSILVVLANLGGGDATTGPDTRSTTAAMIVATDYLAGRTSSIPVADNVPSDFGRDNKSSRGLSVSAATVGAVTRSEVQGFFYDDVEVIVMASGRAYRVRVVLGVTASGPVLAALPTLLPVYVDRSETTPALDWSNFDGAKSTVPAAVNTAISTWATAYAADDRAGLVAITGDTDPSANYRGLGGFKVLDVRADRYFDNGDGTWLVRARVLFSTAGADGLVVESAFDLLVATPQSQFPRVAAWGNPGSGPTLKPAINRQPARAS